MIQKFNTMMLEPGGVQILLLQLEFHNENAKFMSKIAKLRSELRHSW